MRPLAGAARISGANSSGTCRPERGPPERVEDVTCVLFAGLASRAVLAVARAGRPAQRTTRHWPARFELSRGSRRELSPKVSGVRHPAYVAYRTYPFEPNSSPCRPSISPLPHLTPPGDWGQAGSRDPCRGCLSSIILPGLKREVRRGMGDRGDLHTRVKRLIIERLQLEGVSPEDIENAAPLFGDGLGLDSIDALELVIGIEKEFGVRIQDEDVGSQALASVDALVKFLRGAGVADSA